MRVLIIDDNRDSSYVVSVLVSRLGHESMLLTAPQAALDVALEYKPDLVLLDVVMPGLDGYEVAAQLCEQASLDGVKIITVSCYPRDRAREKAACINGYLPKPIGAACLKSLLEDGRPSTRNTQFQGQHYVG